MKAHIEAIHQAMLEGNRDEVLRLLAASSPTDEAAWLRAQSVASDEERYRLLKEASAGTDPLLAGVAARIVGREDEFAKQLEEPPDYKFWKQPTWAGKLGKMRQYGFWLAGGILLVLFSLMGISYNSKYQTQQQVLIGSIKSTQTAVAYANLTAITYPAGRLQLEEIDQPTSRPVTFGEMNGDTPVIATPATGAVFAAARLRFTCSVALCANPPQADLQLLMADGNIISYEGGNRPVLAGAPPTPRISQNQSTELWYVFEVPGNSTPDAILVFPEGSDTPQIINWTNP